MLYLGHVVFRKRMELYLITAESKAEAQRELDKVKYIMIEQPIRRTVVPVIYDIGAANIAHIFSVIE